MSFMRQLVRHINKIITGDGKRRIIYSIVNIVLIAITALCVWGILKSVDIMNDTSFIGGLVLLIFCIICGVAFVINGVIGQLILLVCTFIAMFNPEDRRCNAVAFVIGILSIVGAVVTIIFLV